MRKPKTVVEEKYSNFTTKTNQYCGYKVPTEQQEITRDGAGQTRSTFNRPEPIDKLARASDFTIAASMDAGIDPTTRSVAPKVYGLDSNPEAMQEMIENRTKQLDNEMIVERYKEIQRQKEAEKNEREKFEDMKKEAENV